MSLLVSAPDEGKILACIDKGLDVFGTSVKDVLYFRFRTLHQLERKDILQRPEMFSETIRAFFGERAFSVETAIVGTILESLHPANVTLSDSLTRAITEARNQSRR